LVEVYKDRALALPPLNSTLARRMMESTKIYKALKGVRGRKPIDMAALESLLVAFSNLIVEQRWIKEIDINPLLASPDRLLALDARVVVYDKDKKEEDLPKSAIRPYPTQYVSAAKVKGDEVEIRPIRPEDEPLIVKFHQDLSERSVQLRYFQPMELSQRTAHERLTRICFIDYDRETALVAERKGKDGAEIMGVTRLSRIHGTKSAQLSMIVKDEYQKQGLGTEMVRHTIDIARAEKLNKIVANMLVENKEMQSLCKKLGFDVKAVDEKYVRGELSL
jgi:acetyltransferase